MNRIIFIAVALLMTCALSSCNTFHGFGEDVQHLGSVISQAAS
ncbi:entericidin, EcnA/B family [Erwinia tracheiphila]|uniref:Entericidin, EcnA/B family n=1 Tax=Erwinia tracheiphila TaxID=65700 RepID=A0A345CZH6_9GAMM|nr:entericidin, EcnA/B family [Erwinia tracheiphila]